MDKLIEWLYSKNGLRIGVGINVLGVILNIFPPFSLFWVIAHGVSGYILITEYRKRY